MPEGRTLAAFFAGAIGIPLLITAGFVCLSGTLPGRQSQITAEAAPAEHQGNDICDSHTLDRLRTEALARGYVSQERLESIRSGVEKEHPKCARGP